MAVNTFLGGGGNYLSPLISFYTIFDLDTGLMTLIEDEYFDEDIFDPEFYMLDKLDQIYVMHYRHEDNPLQAIALHPEDDKDLLKEYYDQFMEREIDNILDLSFRTEMWTFLLSSLDTIEIRPTILCYNDKQVSKVREFDEIKSIDVVTIDELDPSKYTQIYVKDIWELDKFLDLEFRTFYIVAYGPNLDDEYRDFKPFEEFVPIIENRNDISALSIYDSNKVGVPKTFLIDERNKNLEPEEDEENNESDGNDNE